MSPTRQLDQISLNRLQLLHPSVRADALSLFTEAHQALTGRAILRLAYTLRTYQEQDQLYALGRTVINQNGKSAKRPMGSIVTQAKGGQSYHNFGLAFDIVLLKDLKGTGKFDQASWETDVDFDGDGQADWQEVVTIAKQHGWEWGGDWKFSDKPHFQKTMGFSVRELAQKVAGGFVVANGTTYPYLSKP